MYRKVFVHKSGLTGVEKYEGETIEQKCRRIVEEDEPIKDGAPEIFTERSKGVIAAYNIRTDRFEVAAEAMDVVHRSKTATRDNVPTEAKPKASGKEGGVDGDQAV